MEGTAVLSLRRSGLALLLAFAAAMGTGGLLTSHAQILVLCCAGFLSAMAGRTGYRLAWSRSAPLIGTEMGMRRMLGVDEENSMLREGCPTCCPSG